jgi:hypothetical protein
VDNPGFTSQGRCEPGGFTTRDPDRGTDPGMRQPQQVASPSHQRSADRTKWLRFTGTRAPATRKSLPLEPSRRRSAASGGSNSMAKDNGVAAGRMIVAYSRGDGAATNYEIAGVTVALQHLRAGDDSGIRIDPVHRWLRTLWFGGRSPATWPPRRPCSPWRTVVILRSRPDHATPRLSIEGRSEDRAAKPCGTRPVPGEPGLTGVWAWPGCLTPPAPGACP